MWLPSLVRCDGHKESRDVGPTSSGQGDSTGANRRTLQYYSTILCLIVRFMNENQNRPQQASRQRKKKKKSDIVSPCEIFFQSKTQKLRRKEEK